MPRRPKSRPENHGTTRSSVSRGTSPELARPPTEHTHAEKIGRRFETVVHELRAENTRLLRLAAFPEQDPNPVIQADLDAQILYANPSALRLFPDLVEKGVAHPWLAGWEDQMRSLDANPTASRTRVVTVGARSWHQVLVGVPGEAAVRVYAFDVTALHEAENALHESEERFRGIVERAEEGIATHDADGTITYVNQRMADMLGYSREEVIGRSSLDFVDDEDKEAVTTARQSVKERGGFSKEWKLRRKDGSQLWTLAHISPRRDGAGNFVGHLAMHTDITGRKRAEEQAGRDLDAMTRLQRLGTLFARDGELGPILEEIVDAAITIADADFGNVQLLDPATGDLRIAAHRGFPPWWVDFWNNASKGTGACGTALERGHPIIVDNVEDSAIFAGKPWLEIQRRAGVHAVLSMPLVGRSGQRVGVVSTLYRRPHQPDERALRLMDVLARQATDIIERARAEEALREGEERLRLAQGVARVGSFEWNIETGVNVWSETLEKMYGLQPGGFAKTQPGWEQLVHPADRAAAVARVEEALATGEAVEGEWRVVWPDGSVHWLVGRFKAFKDERGRPLRLTGVNIDVTDRKRAEEELRHSEQQTRSLNERLLENDRRKNEFIAILSHELRNPLAPIRYALPALQKTGLTDAGGEALDVIVRQVTHLTRLVDDLLDVSRITTGKIELRRDSVTLRSIVRAAVEAAAPVVAAAGHSLNVEIPDAPMWVHGDAARLSQVVTNLLDNSAKYTPRGGQLELTVSCEGDHAHVSVRDNGAGISANELPTLFEMFHQVNRAEKVSAGLGIGLALVKRLVELHGGTVEAHSAGVGLGAEFVVQLPVTADAVSESAGVTPASAVPRRRLRVLIVDDNADLVAMLAMFVESYGHDVRKAFDGPSAVSAAVSYRPDVVLLDVGLPGMTGLDVARELRRRPETNAARLIALTGWGQADDRRASLDAGFDAHLTKPTDPDVLEAVLNCERRTCADCVDNCAAAAGLFSPGPAR